MSCEEVERELVAFLFGEVPAKTRGALEAHLLDCRHCVSGFLSIKRDVELPCEVPAPSPALRTRVRLAVARELGLGPQHARWRVWERPLVVGLAASILLWALAATHQVTTAPGEAPRGAWSASAAPARP